MSSSYTGFSDYGDLGTYKDKAYLQKQAEINNINFVDGREVLQLSLDNFEGVAIRFSIDAIKDSNIRVKYQAGIKRISNEVLNSVDSGKITIAEGVQYANAMRDKIMAESRKITSPQGLAVATVLKKESRGIEYYFNKYANKLFEKEYDQLTEIQKTKVQYAVIEASGRSNAKVTSSNKKLKIMGKVCIIITASIAIYSVIEAENKIREAHIQTGIIVGGVTGGAIAGSVGISLFCGPGAPVCAMAVVVGILGSLGGSVLGAWVGEEIYDEADEFIEWDIF